MARSLVRWEPTRDLVSMQDAIDRLFDRAFDDWFFRPLAPFGLSSDGLLAVDVYETADRVVVKTAIPGVKAEDIDISVSNGTLSIKAETQEKDEVKRENYLRRERRFGAHHRSVSLPGGLITDDAEADYADGILTLTFPKAEEVRPKSIKIRTK